MKRINAKDYVSHIPFFVLLVLTILLNQFVTMHGDDLRYSTYLGLLPSFKGQAATWANIIHTQMYDYFHLNGRFLFNVFCIIILVHGIELWRILNPIFLTTLAYEMFYIVETRFPQKEDLWKTILISAIIYLLHFQIIDQTIDYATGSFNYLYPMVFLLSLIIFFRRYDLGKPLQNKLLIVLFPLIGFISGWSQEQVSILAIGFVVLWIGKEYLESKKVYKLHIVVLIATLTGCLGLFLAPGPKLRSALPAFHHYNQLSLFRKITYSMPGVMRFFVNQEAVCTIFITILLAILCYKKSPKLIWLVTIGITLIPFVFSTPFFHIGLFKLMMGYYLPISLFGLFLMIAILGMSYYLKDKNYLIISLSLGFLIANFVMVFTPSYTGGRVAFPAIPLAICLIIFLLQKFERKIFQLFFAVFIALCALINYSSILLDTIIRWLHT